VPASVSWLEELIEGQAEAAVTVPVPGVGVGVPVDGVGVGLTITLPPVPGLEMSLGPQPASASALQPTSSRPWMFFTDVSPNGWTNHGASPPPLGAC
jgi:hypothetical protein